MMGYIQAIFIFAWLDSHKTPFCFLAEINSTASLSSEENLKSDDRQWPVHVAIG